MAENKEKSKNGTARSAVLFLISTVIFGSIGIFRRSIPLPSASLAFLRGLTGSAFILLFSLVTGKKIFRGISRKNLILLIASGACIGINWIFLFEAFNYTAVTTATLCCYMQPTIVLLLSPLIFREKLGPKKLVCVVLSLVGMVFVSGMLDKGLPQGSDAVGILCGLGCAAFFSAVVILTKLIDGVNPFAKTVIQLFSAAVAVLPYAWLTGFAPTAEMGGKEILFTVIVCVVHTGLAYLLYFGGMAGLKTQTVAFLSYADPVSSIVLSAVILGERMTFLGALGAVLILGSTLAAESKGPYFLKRK
ncbi:MAG: EamA family transporter [Firmicutes bacterium]|nr:EamA family transporter [Candidatus Colimorpha enterica]